MILLLLASFWTWAIIFDKALRLRRLRSQAEQFEESFWSGGSLEELFDRIGRPAARSDVGDLRRRHARMAPQRRQGPARRPSSMRTSLQERIERVMDITLGREMEQLERHMTFLASVGSSAPFVGLFGTVWGIMNSFASIAASKNTTLAVVAPGIAEALVRHRAGPGRGHPGGARL